MFAARTCPNFLKPPLLLTRFSFGSEPGPRAEAPEDPRAGRPGRVGQGGGAGGREGGGTEGRQWSIQLPRVIGGLVDLFSSSSARRPESRGSVGDSRLLIRLAPLGPRLDGGAGPLLLRALPLRRWPHQGPPGAPRLPACRTPESGGRSRNACRSTSRSSATSRAYMRCRLASQRWNESKNDRGGTPCTTASRTFGFKWSKCANASASNAARCRRRGGGQRRHRPAAAADVALSRPLRPEAARRVGCPCPPRPPRLDPSHGGR